MKRINRNHNGNGARPRRRPSAPTASRTKGANIGMLEWFRPGEHDRVDRVLDELAVLGVKDLRTGISWADWHTREGEAWYAWLLPQLARRVNLLPCFLYTPPSWGITPKTSAPPREPRAYADFLDQMVSRFGKYFDWVELWNEPNNLREWDVTLDPYWFKFSEMLGGQLRECGAEELGPRRRPGAGGLEDTGDGIIGVAGVELLHVGLL